MGKLSVIYYTDGACSGNPGPGGWAAVCLKECTCGYKTEIISGGKENTTNNEMELTAAYKALVKAYKSGKKQVTIYSDNAYVVNAIKNRWLCNWCENGWKTREGKEIKNKHIWEKMYKLVYERGMYVDMRKVKGHSGDPLNELADRAAVRMRNEYSNGRR